MIAEKYNLRWLKVVFFVFLAMVKMFLYPQSRRMPILAQQQFTVECQTLLTPVINKLPSLYQMS